MDSQPCPGELCCEGHAVGQPLTTQPSPHRSHPAMPGWAALGHAVETQLGVGGPPSPHRDGEREAMGPCCAPRSPVPPSRPRTSTCPQSPAAWRPARARRCPQPAMPPWDSAVRRCDITATLRAPCPALCVRVCVCVRATCGQVPTKGRGTEGGAERFGRGTFVPGRCVPAGARSERSGPCALPPPPPGEALGGCGARRCPAAGWEAGVGAALSGGFNCGVINVWRRAACWRFPLSAPCGVGPAWSVPSAGSMALRCGFVPCVVGIPQGEGFCGCSSCGRESRGRGNPCAGVGPPRTTGPFRLQGAGLCHFCPYHDPWWLCSASS